MKYAYYDETNGKLLGWYDTEIHGVLVPAEYDEEGNEIAEEYYDISGLPEPKLEVTDEAWQEAIDNGYNYVDVSTGELSKVDFRTDEEIAEAELNAWKRSRDEAVANIVVEYNGIQYQGDEKSQDRMSRAINGLPDDTTEIGWVAADNSMQMLNKADLQTILAMAGAEQARLWVEGRPE